MVSEKSKYKLAFILLLIIVRANLHGQLVPKFDKSAGDTLGLFSNMPIIVSLHLGQSDPSLISLRSSEISNHMISRFDDSTFVINLNRPVSEAKLKLYYKNLPVDLYLANVSSLEFPKILISNIHDKIYKNLLSEVMVLECSIDENYSKKYRVYLHSFNINILHLNGKKEVIPNFNVNIANNNFLRIKTLPTDSVVFFSNVKLRTIYNNIIELKGESEKFIISE